MPRLSGAEMSTMRASLRTRRLAATHWQLQVLEVCPNVRGLPVPEPPFAVTRRVFVTLKLAHEWLIFQMTCGGILDDPKPRRRAIDDSQCSFHIFRPGAQVTRPRGERNGEFGARRARVHHHDVGAGAVCQKRIKCALAIPPVDVCADGWLEFGVYVYGEEPEIVESAADARPPHGL